MHLHEAGIDLARKPPVRFDPAAELDHRRGVHVVDPLHRMRVAHRQHRHLDGVAAFQLERPHLEAAERARRQAAGVERQRVVLEHRSAHVDRDTTIVLQPQLEHAVHRLDVDRAARGQAAVAHETHEAARAVAAVLDLIAAGAVEDAVAKVHVGFAARLDDEDLVGADPEASIAEAAHRPGVERDRLTRRIEHDEVVAGAVHLREAELIGHREGASPYGRRDALRLPALRLLRFR